jgi:hypothetical protein
MYKFSVTIITDAHFASRRIQPYISAMAIFPRPVSPRSAAGDLWSYLSERRAHKWPLLGVSTALTWVIVWAFFVDANTNTAPRQNQIIYFQNWSAGRSDVDVILEQKRDLAERVRLLHKKQAEMQKVADMFGIEWREDARRNQAREAEAVRILNARLDAELAKAQAKLDAGKPLTTVNSEPSAPGKAP